MGCVERELLGFEFSEDDDSGEVNEDLELMTPSSVLSPTKEASASLYPAGPLSLAPDSQRRNVQKVLCEPSRCRRIDEAMGLFFLGTWQEEDWERCQGEFERQIVIV